MPKIDAFLQLLADHGASDLHLIAGSPPVVRLNGDLQRVAFRDIAPGEVRAMMYELLTPEQIERYERSREIDFSYELRGQCRFRVNAYLHREGPGIAFRAIPNRIPTLQELRLPPVLEALATLERGLVLVTGPTGSGKSTTLAAIIDLINRTTSRHILTIEDPVEYVHLSQRAYVSQREVGTHANDFASAMRAALRESANVVLVGELRDLETISLALDMTETGTVVFSTLHTNSAGRTIDRIVDVFPADQRPGVASMLAGSLRAVVSQQLVRTADGMGRVAAVEVLRGTHALANIIREGKTHQIDTLIQAGVGLGMQAMDTALLDLVNRGHVAMEEAASYALDREEFLNRCRRGLAQGDAVAGRGGGAGAQDAA
jgi:twitching motility protein PilT